MSALRFIGDTGLLVPVGGWRQAASLARAIRSRPPPGMVDALEGWRSVVVTVDPLWRGISTVRRP